MSPSTKLILIFGHTVCPPWYVLIPYLRLWEPSRLNRGPSPSESLPRTIQSLAGPANTHYQIALSGAHLPRPVGSSPQQYQLRVSTSDSQLPCAGHRGQRYTIGSLPSRRASVLREAGHPTPNRCPPHAQNRDKLATYSGPQRKEGRPSGKRGS